MKTEMEMKLTTERKDDKKTNSTTPKRLVPDRTDAISVALHSYYYYSRVRTVRASSSASVNLAPSTLENSGSMVIPACPPITVTSTSFGSNPMLLATKVFARQTSRVVTPKSFLGSYTPAFLRISAAIGTVELTGLLMMAVFGKLEVER